MIRAIVTAAALLCLEHESAIAADPWVGQGKVMPTRAAGVSVQSPQMILKINKEIGEPVKKGEVLVRCDDKQAKIALNMTKLVLKKAEFEVKNAESRLAIAKASLQAQKNKADLDRAEADVALATGQVEVAKIDLEIQKELVAEAERKVEALVLKSPFDGVVVARFSEPGDLVTGASPILNVMGGSTIIEAEVPDRLFKLVGPKHPVEVTTLKEFGGHTFKGEISRKQNLVDPDKRSFMIHVSLPEGAQQALFYGMVVNMKIVGKEPETKEKKESNDKE